MQNYQKLLKEIFINGERRENRTGIPTLALFGKSLRFDLTKGFPAVTTKKLFFNSVAAELAGFLEGTEDARRIRELGTSIWDANANAPEWQASRYCDGPDHMGPVYGAQWRNFNAEGYDQLADVVETLISNPLDRRMVVTAWNPAELKKMCLPPCHIFYQFYVRENKYLDCQWYIRSVDMFLGMPFDIASYALLTHIIAQQVDLVPGEMIAVTGDTHIYINHLAQVEILLERTPFSLPVLHLSDEATIDNFKPNMAKLINYKHHPAIIAPMAV